MIIHLAGLGKRYNRDWIFRHLTLSIGQGATLAILGPNGSGKSTLLHCIWGQTIPSEGTIRYEQDGKSVEPEDLNTAITIAAPYMDLIEEFTLREQLEFHFHYKRPVHAPGLADLADRIGLPLRSEKRIREFSSGMKQRLKLGLALLSEASVTFLDEPTTNLDKTAEKWYFDLISGISDRTLIIATNSETDLPAGAARLNTSDYKWTSK